MKVLVTGATGAVGPVVVAALEREGHTVVPFSRATGGDVTERDAVFRAAAGVDAIVHLAALLHVRSAPAAEYERINVGGTRNVVATGKRVIFGSTIAVYGYDRRIVLDEATPLQPDTEYGRSKARAEELVRAAGGTVLRFAAVYGARVKGNYAALVRWMRRGLFVPIGDGRNRRTVIYDEDLAAGVVAVLAAPEKTAGETYNVAHPHAPQVREILAAIAAAVGRRPPRFHLPVPPRFVIPPKLRPRYDKYLEDVVVSPEKLRRELGFVAPTDLREGWKKALQR